MAKYSDFIDGRRRSVPTPASLADSSGKCVFGTFSSEFENLNLLEVKKPTSAPDLMKKMKLTLWEATEIHLKEGILLCVICDMGVFGKVLNVWYSYRTGKVIAFDESLKSEDTHIAPNLLNHSKAQAETAHGEISYDNDFGNGRASVSGTNSSAEHHIAYSFHLSQVSPQSVVSIPFGKNRPLYTEKMMFAAAGSLKVDDEVYACDDFSTAIIDDHRGYYPRKMHYDWVSSMGRYEMDGKKQYFGFNLTRNQSMNQAAYNENLIWLEGRSSLLPPVVFTRSMPMAQFKDTALWRIRDDHDMVHVDYTVAAVHPTVVHAPAISVDYYFTFGMLSGYLRDEDGKKYILDGMHGMAEDKTMLF